MSHKSKKRKVAGLLDISDLPITNTKRPLYTSNNDTTRPNVKLRALMDQEKYREARILFQEMVNSNKFKFKNLWQAGVEIIGKAAPQELTGYLKAVFISSPVSLTAETFNVYMDQLIIEEKYAEAFEEMESRYITPIYHHPILLRKMALCSYHLWKQAREKLPENYLQDEEEGLMDQEEYQYDVNIKKYTKYTRSTQKLLADAHRTYLRDVELLKMYIDFLTLTKDNDTKAQATLKSLEAFHADPDYYLLYNLMKLNNNDEYFDNDDYMLRLFEFDPYLNTKQLGFKSYCRNQAKSIRTLRNEPNTAKELLDESNKLAARLFRLYVNRVEHGNPESWFSKLILFLFENALSVELVDIYYYYNVDQLLRSSFVLDKVIKSKEKFTQVTEKLKQIVHDFARKEMIRKNDIKEEEEDDDMEEVEDAEEGKPRPNGCTKASEDMIVINVDEEEDEEEEDNTGLEKETFLLQQLDGQDSEEEEQEEEGSDSEQDDEQNEEEVPRSRRISNSSHNNLLADSSEEEEE